MSADELRQRFTDVRLHHTKLEQLIALLKWKEAAQLKAEILGKPLPRGQVVPMRRVLRIVEAGPGGRR